MLPALFSFLGLCHEMAVAEVDILLKGLCIPESGLNPAVAQEALHLFQGHAALEGQAGGSVRKMCGVTWTLMEQRERIF